jgi:hypothetical protein
MGKGLESGNICDLTCPSLQDLPWQEPGNNCLVSQEISALTRPSLQDFEADAFCPALSAKIGYVLHTQDVDPYTAASNPGFVPPSTAEPLVYHLGSLGHFSSFAVAIVFSGNADNSFFYRIDDS